ncbi:hypothetical protein [Sphingobacterium sp. UDSM-2020]|uniref:hypothetical protein n=1 Tax=Sphingobacterium sp. UDSM-2020 TaxID=2795738 RepID=UPI001938E094|nr:hypothetical protein [Sphingobacterium sp. UDSM-2020]QQD16042.1 hypothetical protein JAZ75_11200 [Sphingobacterium sp. UDSM-2020]
MAWYVFTPSGLSRDPCDPNQYTLVGMNTPACSGVNNYLCAIQATDNMGQPIMTVMLICEIVRALENKTNSVNVFLKP